MVLESKSGLMHDFIQETLSVMDTNDLDEFEAPWGEATEDSER